MRHHGVPTAAHTAPSDGKKKENSIHSKSNVVTSLVLIYMLGALILNNMHILNKVLTSKFY